LSLWKWPGVIIATHSHGSGISAQSLRGISFHAPSQCAGVRRGEQQEWNNRCACEGTESWNPWRWSVFEEEKEEEKMEEEEDRLGNGRENVFFS
jgi:hypothetical protein